MTKIITKCRICGSERLQTLFDLGEVCHAGVFTPDGNVIKDPLEIVRCKDESGCGLVQLKHEFDPNVMYGEHYGYRSGLNSSMVDHLRDVAINAREYYAPKHGEIITILDIGSNDGTLLGHFKDVYSEKAKLFGIDPSSEKFSEYYPNGVVRSKEFFSKSEFLKLSGGTKADIVTSIAMFYDLPDPQRIVNEISEILDQNGLWIVEQSYLPTMLGSNSFDTICHEHTEYYTLSQFEWMCEISGMCIENMELNSANGGSFRLYIRKKGINSLKTKNVEQFHYIEKTLAYNWEEQFEIFDQRITAQRTNLASYLKQLTENQIEICGLGASTKGNILLQHFEFDTTIISAIAEVNPDKYGLKTPGTKIPIIDQSEALRKFDYFLVLPWHFKSNFIQNPKFKEKTLIFPLPELEIIKL